MHKLSVVLVSVMVLLSMILTACQPATPTPAVEVPAEVEPTQAAEQPTQAPAEPTQAPQAEARWTKPIVIG
jgi:hypothetical protein